MDNRAVGIFDSGFGGLTAMRELRRLLPGENIIYFGDSGRMPYGPRPREQVRKFSRQNLEFVSGFGVKAVIVACGTISSNAADLLEQWPVHTVDVLKPGAAAIAALPGRGPLGVIATAASIRSGAFEAALREKCPGREVIAVACPDFVPLIESGHYSAGDPALQAAVAEYLAPMKAAGIDALLLGCTHYGLIRGALSAYLGAQVQLVGAAECAAAETAKYLQENGLCGSEGREEFYTSGNPADFTGPAALFLNRSDCPQATYVAPREE